VVYTSDANRNTVGLETEHVIVEDCVSNVKKTVCKSEMAVEDEYGQESHVEREKSLRIEMPREHHVKQQTVKDLAQSRNKLAMKNAELREKSCSKGAVRHHRHRRKHDGSRKRSYREGAIFEGERVSYLVGQCEAAEAHPSAGNEEQSSLKEDDYVLRKLFEKSGETYTYKVCFPHAFHVPH
jgi:hypothetical protein